MRHTGYITAVIAAIALSTACNRDSLLDVPDYGGAVRIDVKVSDFSAAGATRTADTGYSTAFVAGDRIGITVVKDGAAIVENNIPYQYNGSTWGPVNSSNAIHRYPGDISYLVYYPYNEAMNGKRTAAQIVGAFTPGADQGTQSSHSTSDLMTGSGSFAATQLSVTLTHNLSLVEINLPSGSSDITLKVNGGNEYLPYNITGTTFRCIVKPVEGAVLSGTYTIAGTTLSWRKEDVTLSAGEYTRINAVNAVYVGNIKVNYAGGGTETVLYDPLTGNIALTRSGEKIETIELPDANGKSYPIGRVAGNVLALNIQGNGDLQFRDADGDGYIPIGSYAEFQLIGTVQDALGGSYQQEVDIDLMNREWTPVGSAAKIANESNFKPFTGRYYGAGHTIANLKITGPEYNSGLFGCISNAEIENLHIVSGSVRGRENLGGICGYVFRGSIIACSNAASVNGTNMVGGVAGGNAEGAIVACRNSGAISGDRNTGGIAGINAADMVACYNTGAITAEDSVGGIVGMNDVGGFVSACYNLGMIAGDIPAGGVVGVNYGHVASCYWKSDTSTKGVNNLTFTEEGEDDVVGTSVDVVGFSLPAGFTPDAVTYPDWNINDGYWENHTGNNGMPQLWWE